jgi:probable rRNA maturation factor
VIDVVDGRGRPARAPGLARWLARTAPVTLDGRVVLALVADTHMRRLNRAFRSADYATDVLSFPSESTPAAPRGARRQRASPHESAFLGDIVIATGVAARQAQEQGHALATELRVLALHGLLHLLGYDHEGDGGRMHRVERRWRRRGGLSAGLIEREGPQ